MLVQCNASLSKNYIAHSITVVCVIGWIREKRTALSALSVHMKSVVEQGFFHKFAFHNKALKNFVEYSNLLKTFVSLNVVEFECELRHISTHNTLSASSTIRPL